MTSKDRKKINKQWRSIISKNGIASIEESKLSYKKIIKKRQINFNKCLKTKLCSIPSKKKRPWKTDVNFKLEINGCKTNTMDLSVRFMHNSQSSTNSMSVSKD